jgi:ribosome biogenesis GTPase A
MKQKRVYYLRSENFLETNLLIFLKADLKHRKKLIAAYSHHTLYECVKKIASKKYQHINIDNWADLIRKIEATVDIESLKLHELQIGNEQVSTSNDPISDSSSKDEKKFITIGCCGFPNVGKSSLLNSLFGKKVVSVSRTPQ